LLAITGCTSHRPATTARSETAERLSEEARQARDRGDLQSAEYLLTAAVDHNPGDGETRLELAELLLAHGSSEAAAWHLKKFIDQCPDDPRGYVALAEARFLQQSLSEAEELIEKAIELDPRQSRGLLLRGKIEQARHEDGRALEDFYQVLAIEADHIEAKMLISAIHLRQGNAELAAPLLRSVIEDAEPANPQRAAAQWLLGECYLCDGRWSDAARELEAGIASRRGSERDWYELAEASWRAGDVRGAELAVFQALRVAPADPPSLALRALLDNQPRPLGLSHGPVVTGHPHDESVPDPPRVLE
jgi:predicted Zn-dependent protease